MHQDNEKILQLTKDMAKVLLQNKEGDIFCAVSNLMASLAATCSPDDQEKYIFELAKYAVEIVEYNNGVPKISIREH